MKNKPTVGSPFSGAFLSDLIPKATKDVSVHFFTESSNSSKLNQPRVGTFEVTTYYTNVCGKMYVTTHLYNIV